VVNVDFEWFNFDPEVDFHGTKTLLRQLFDVDANLFNMSALADLVLSQPTIGSTIKVDGKANDAYALLTVLNTAVHQDKEPMTDHQVSCGEGANQFVHSAYCRCPQQQQACRARLL
jgi:protein BCP1